MPDFPVDGSNGGGRGERGVECKPPAVLCQLRNPIFWRADLFMFSCLRCEYVFSVTSKSS